MAPQQFTPSLLQARQRASLAICWPFAHTWKAASVSREAGRYLLSIGAGTEPFTGSGAVFSNSAYKSVVN
jgi:hypothetical protein